MSDATQARERIDTFRIYLAILLGLLFLGGILFIAIDGATVDTMVALVGTLVGFAFLLVISQVARAPSTQAIPSLYVIMGSFLFLHVLGNLLAVVLWGTLGPIEILGVLIVLAAVFLMIQMIADTRKLAGQTTPASSASPAPQPSEPPPPGPTASTPAAFCPNCGTQVASPGAKFCRNCGAEL